jgi:histidine ammonia-lyase
LKTILIDGQNLTIGQVTEIAKGKAKLDINPDAHGKIDRSREYIEKILDDGKPHYGINTGFGDFASVRVSKEDLKQLQVNLVRSHSVGVGELLPIPIVRAMMVLRANTLCRGCSGVRRSVIETIIKMVNEGVHPIVPSKGSVGASGDLAPLSHIALSLIGEGESEYKGKVYTGGEALKLAGIEPVQLMEKEGLALINGTQFMAGIGCIAAEEISRLITVADIAGSLSIEVLMGTDQAFLDIIQQERPHKGQIDSARNVLACLKDSSIVQSHKDCSKVQDAYSLRCIPPVHGAAREGLRFAESVFTTEINSSVDNPLVFPDEDIVISGGNFHGAPVALVLETLAVSLSFIANISERRTERMMNHHYSGLPAFLAKNGGLNSGLMIAHYLTAALASENKVLCHPACCDTIPTSAGQEDHVSMGSISATKLLKILENTWTILGVEILSATQAMEFMDPIRMGKGFRVVYEIIRNQIPPLEKDRPLRQDILKVTDIIRHEEFLRKVEEKTGAFSG